MVAGALGVLACSSRSPADLLPPELPPGNWGGERVGLIVTEELAHVHVNCTKGDFPGPIPLDEDGRFSVAGDYLVKAYPVAIGPTMPAVFAGVLRGDDLTFTVAVNDTIDKELVVLGPVTATYGREPEMGPCPICESPGADAGSSGTSTVMGDSETGGRGWLASLRSSALVRWLRHPRWPRRSR